MSIWLIYLAVMVVAMVLYYAVRMAMRSHAHKVITGEVGMIGMSGRAETELAPDGTVFVHGELWRARAGLHIRAGEPIRVVGVDGLTLEVEPLNKDRAMIRRQESLFNERASSEGEDYG